MEDKENFDALDEARCMLCGAYGTDKRSLIVECMYDVQEAIPEALDLHFVEGRLQGRGYYLRICKPCRSGFLKMLHDWANTRKALRSLPKTHDGELLEKDGNEEIL